MKTTTTFLLFYLSLIIPVFSQLDTVFLKSGEQITSTFKVADNRRMVFDQQKDGNNFSVETIAYLFSQGQYYRPVSFVSDDGEMDYLATEVYRTTTLTLLELETDLRISSPHKYSHTLYFIQRDGETRLVNRHNLQGFYRGYFEECYDQIPKKKKSYNKKSIAYMLESYSQCKGEQAIGFIEQKKRKLINLRSAVNLYAGYSNRTFELNYFVYTNAEIEETATFLGLGYSLFMDQPFSYGLDIDLRTTGFSTNKFSLINASREIALSEKLDYEMLNLTFMPHIAYQFKREKWLIRPAFGVRLGTYIITSRADIDNEIILASEKISSQIFADAVWDLHQINIGAAAYVDLHYQLSTSFSLMFNGGYYYDYQEAAIEDGANNLLAVGDFWAQGLNASLGISYLFKKK